MPGHLAHYSDFIEWSAYFEFEMACIILTVCDVNQSYYHHQTEHDTPHS